MEIKNRTYKNNVTIKDDGIHEEAHSSRVNGETITFVNCTFEKDVTILNGSKSITFKNCKLYGELFQPSYHQNIFFEGPETHLHEVVNQHLNIKGGKIDLYYIDSQKFDEKFYINVSGEEKLSIGTLKVTSTNFNKNVKFHNCKISCLTLKNVNFHTLADFSGCHFIGGHSPSNIITFSQIIFQGLAIYSDAIFDRYTQFDRCTFFEQAHFKRTHFSDGLNLDNIAPKKELNFAGVTGLDTQQSIRNTPTETYRTIKYYFDKAKNRIEANKFHALELKAHLYHDQDKIKLYDRLLLYIHNSSSGFGVSWIRPLIGIGLVGIFFGWLYFNTHPKCNFIDKSLHFMSIFYNGDEEKKYFYKHPFLMLLHKGVLGYLYYQFIQAVRKDTRK